ncbi:tripartite tricarboxylate transporter permease, partial [Selenomonas sp.]
IAASEAANNAAAAGAFAPLLALGIPGSGTGAVLLGGLMMWGLNPGPLLFVNEPDFTWGLIASLFFSNIFALVVAVSVIPFLIKILTVPIRFLIPVVITICVVGAYSSSFSMYGVLVMLISGIVCYFLAKAGYPTAPMILSFVLASLLESNMRKAFIVSGGSLDIFVQRPISCALTIVFLIFVGTPIIRALIRRFRKKPEAV